MKALLTIATFLWVLLPTTSDVKMKWEKDRKLTWEDFRGTPSGSASYVASTNSGISFSYAYTTRNGVTDVTFKVQCYFYPELSWYRRGSVNNYILEHEQTHFDISELYARKLRQKLSSVRFDANFENTVNSIYEANELERQSMQRQYDSETQHSIIKEKEYQWRSYIATQLEAYNDWR